MRRRTARCRRCRSIWSRPGAAPSARLEALASASPSACLEAAERLDLRFFSASVRSFLGQLAAAIPPASRHGRGLPLGAHRRFQPLEVRCRRRLSKLVEMALVLHQRSRGRNSRNHRRCSRPRRLSTCLPPASDIPCKLTGTLGLAQLQEEVPRTSPRLSCEVVSARSRRAMKASRSNRLHILLVLEQRAVQRRDQMLGLVRGAQRAPGSHVLRPSAASASPAVRRSRASCFRPGTSRIS